MLRNNTSLFRDNTPPIAEIICVKNVGAIVVCGFKKYAESMKISWEPFQSCQSNPFPPKFAPTFLTHTISAIGGVIRQ